MNSVLQLSLLVLLMTLCTAIAQRPPKKCKPPPSLAKYNMRPVGNRSKIYYPGDKILYKCKTGYAPKGDTKEGTLTCTKKGRFPNKPETTFRCKVAKDCGQVPPGKNVEDKNLPKSLASGKYYRYMCMKGYKPVDAKMMRIMCEGGKYSMEKGPICEEIMCTRMENGRNSISPKIPMTEVGMSRAYTCDPGFVADCVDLVVTCMGNGQWNKGPPGCIEDVP